MPAPLPFTFDPDVDLMIERVIDVPPHLVWRAWTEPANLMPWFCPRPWSVTHCDIDLRPGGTFATTMRSPDGNEFPNVGCLLEIVPERRLVFTDAMLTDFRPSANPFMTGVVLIEPHGAGTHYRAIARHKDVETRAKHEEMGFALGWNAALDQLVEHAATMRS
ncbi:MAG TPA: SRPBCC family protein [Gemmatimonadaceae bacterium]|nr:SRPBCC family protein [Gemmatimonadaceae bacterium]